jgi:hypothetical protein
MGNRAMKNVTITVDEETAQWARQRSAELGISVSRLVGEMLRGQMQQDQRYELAMRQYLALQPRPLGAPNQGYASREEIHDRARLR